MQPRLFGGRLPPALQGSGETLRAMSFKFNRVATGLGAEVSDGCLGLAPMGQVCGEVSAWYLEAGGSQKEKIVNSCATSCLGAKGSTKSALPLHRPARRCPEATCTNFWRADALRNVTKA